MLIYADDIILLAEIEDNMEEYAWKTKKISSRRKD